MSAKDNADLSVSKFCPPLSPISSAGAATNQPGGRLARLSRHHAGGGVAPQGRVKQRAQPRGGVLPFRCGGRAVRERRQRRSERVGAEARLVQRDAERPHIDSRAELRAELERHLGS